MNCASISSTIAPYFWFFINMSQNLINEEPNYIVFYDGECGFCNHTVALVLKNEKEQLLHFAALQSEFAKHFFEKHNITLIDLNTFYFFSDGSFHERSDASIELSKHLRFPISTARYFKWIPKYLRDSVYNLIARNRKKLAGNYCFLPDAEQRKRFIG
jgi:predicted DCC family thiol-disulfide oxidoreductase YuxK